MKTTVELDDNLVMRAKQLAAARGTTLRTIIEDALRENLLGTTPAAGRAYRLEAPVVHGKSPPGVDIADRNALYDLMEQG